MEVLMTITVLGTGYVGLTSAAIFAAAGFTTYVVDVDPKRLDSVRKGKSFFYEEGLDPIIANVVKNGTLIPTQSYQISVLKSDIVFSCVGTPANPDGSSNLAYVFSAAKEASKYIKPDSVYVQKSTVPVGTGNEVKKVFSETKKEIHYVSNPEFLREGTALIDSLWFDRIVVGGTSKKAIQKVIDLYKAVEQKRESIAQLAKLRVPENQTGKYITTNLNSAELIKVSANAFLAMKISFANSIAKLADKADADVVEVMDAVGADARIGRAFLNAGRGYGGGCFPKDVSGLISSGIEHGVNLDIVQATADVNASMPDYIVERIKEAFNNKLEGKKIAVLGLAFKKGTSDTRLSPGIKIANTLDKFGASVTTFDPEAMQEADKELANGIERSKSADLALQNADAVLITTDWIDFTSLPVDQYSKNLAKGALFVDCMNCFADIEAIEETGLKYLGIGRRSTHH